MLQEERDRLSRIEHEVGELKDKLNRYLDMEEKRNPKLDEVLETFSQAQGVLKFIKVCASVGASIGAVYLFFRELLQHWKG